MSVILNWRCDFCNGELVPIAYPDNKCMYVRCRKCGVGAKHYLDGRTIWDEGAS
jgi:hypothetical protein